MRIVILGATGNIGKNIVDQALQAGHDVVAYVRRPEAIEQRPGLTIIGGQLTDIESATKAFTGADAVVCSVGPSLGFSTVFKSVDFMQSNLPPILRAVKAAGVQRFVLISAFGVGETSRKASGFARLVYSTAMKSIFTDKDLAETALETSGLDWTIVYPVNLKDASALPAPAIKDLTEVGSVPGLPTLPFADAAAAVLKIATDTSYSGRKVLVTTPDGWRPA